MLLELAIGDAYGAGFEYADPAFVATHNTLGGYTRHPRHDLPPGHYTDDTQMTLALAELLATDAPWTRTTLSDKFVEVFHRDPRPGYASRFHALLSTVDSGADLLARLRPDSDKSGAAMRVCPVGLLPSVADVLDHAEIQARITHDTRDGVLAAQAAALAVHYCHYELGPVADTARWISGLLEGDWGLPWREPVGAKGWMSVRAALTSLVTQAENGLAAILRASIAYTGDVDTVATIALGAASRSRQVAQDLPKHLLSNLENGPYGRDYLSSLDSILLSRYS
ncbi:ADP-ribosylglycohydrolase family protein [Actinokineospora enzanensis]|uniref:ADP-ribosylglycohydrolase family protein n=1 Tax=Actinokineospora enzanensis TaxID=155975 RepID=UPI0003603FE1|nr:ADP-ribosylglycohydrolase family protein [Actinokineospora enzanensis]